MLHLPTTVAAILAELDDQFRGDNMALSHLMEFDSPITVHGDGTVTAAPRNVYAPTLYDDELDSDSWTLLDGYSGQQGYSGPVMHSSEFIGGRMALDILSEPGTYVAVVSDYSPDELTADDIPDDFPVRPYDLNGHDPSTPLGSADLSDSIATCGTCGLAWDDSISTAYTPAPSARCPFEEFHPSEDNVEGWAVAKLNA